ncbi:XAC2610-related protein [Fodinibius sp. AD559]|uniref:XAC2610-related protein n=1 Tax=Fodinibius sp. AD559 TaxID=3424179 RepID=UPI004046FC8B
MRVFLIICFFFGMIGTCYSQETNLISEEDSVFEQNGLLHSIQKAKVRINSSLPIYRIEFKSAELPKEEFQRSKKEAVFTINVYKNDSNELIQTISDTLKDRTPLLGTMNYKQEFPDINFDGYTDLPVKVRGGMSRNKVYDFWLFDNETGKFVVNPEFTDLINPFIKLEGEGNKIGVFATSGCSGHRCGTSKVFKVKGDKLQLVERESTSLEEMNSNNYFITVYEELRNGKLDTVKIDTSKIEE